MGHNPLFYVDPSGFCGVEFGFEKDIKLTPYGQGDSDDNDGILQNISEFIFGEPAEGAEILRDVLEDNRNPAEREYDRVLEEQERERKQNEPNLWEKFQDWLNELTNRNDSTEFDPNNINFDTYKSKVDPFNIETFPSSGDFLNRDTSTTFPDGDVSFDLTTPIPDFDNDTKDLLTDVFDIFRGPAAKEYDWEHIMDRHTPWGKTAQQSGKKDLFEGMTENEIKRSVQNPWKNRENIRTQKNDIDGDRIIYRGYDSESGYEIEMILDKNTQTVETAYPVNK